MKKIPSTTVVWAFENPLAPNQVHYMPTRLAGAKLVKVLTKQFRGKAEMIAHFEIDPSRIVSDEFQGALTDELLEASGVMLQRGSLGNKAVYLGGNSVSIYLDMKLQNGVGFTINAMQTFFKFVKAIADSNNPYHLHLPSPTVTQEDMVEAYAEDNWIPFGEYMWDKFMTHEQFADFLAS